MIARKHNVTGIKGLSVSLESVNSRGYKTKKYIVNFTDEGKTKGKTFYFGKKTDIKEAFIKASLFMIKMKLTSLNIDECLVIFEEKEHESLFDKKIVQPKQKNHKLEIWE